MFSIMKNQIKYFLKLFKAEARHRPIFFHGFSHILWRMANVLPGKLGFGVRHLILKIMIKK